MNCPDTEDLEEIKRTGPTTERERILLEALQEETAIKDSLTGLFNDYPATDDIRPDLERIKEALEELRELADKEAEAWFTGKNTPSPSLTSDNPMERFAAMSCKVFSLFDEIFIDFAGLEALTLAGEVYEIAEKANLEVYR
jgi:HEPN domain-containing protein